VPYYRWTEQYQAAVLEPDSEKMLDQAIKAETLIEQRREEFFANLRLMLMNYKPSQTRCVF
jgi:hypothetical protein